MPSPLPWLPIALRHKVLHLATRGKGGPHSAPLWFAVCPDPFGLVWVSDPTSLHSRHLASDPRVAASTAPSVPSLEQGDGVQVRGTASAPAQSPLRAAFLARFPETRPWLASQPDHRFYLLQPTWARWITIADRQVHRWEWDMAVTSSPPGS